MRASPMSLEEIDARIEALEGQTRNGGSVGSLKRLERLRRMRRRKIEIAQQKQGVFDERGATPTFEVGFRSGIRKGV